MRILVITPYFYPHPGGSQHYIEELYSALMESNSDIEVDIICYNTEKTKEEERYKNFNVYRVDALEILTDQFALPNYLELISLIKRLKKNHTYQVVNAHTRFFDCSWWTPYIAKYLNAKSILTDHCAHHPVHDSKLVSGIVRVVDRILTPLIAKKYDEITVTNKATQKFFKNLTGSSSRIIYPGLPQVDNKKSKINIDKNKILVGFVGRMISSKNPGLVVLAAQNITKKYPSVDFYLAGDGPLLPQLKQDDNSQIKFLGKLSRERLQKLLKKTDILVHPSQHHEGLPLTLLEAGIANCAVIATDQGGTKEIIKNKKTGIIIKPNKKELIQTLEKLIKNSNLRQRLSKNLNIKVKKEFSWKKSADEFINLISKKH